MTYTIHPFGERALLVTLPHATSPTLISSALAAQLGVTARVGLDSVLVLADTLPTEGAIHAIIHNAASSARESQANHTTIPVHYNGEDLHAIADALRMPVDDVIAAHQNTTWRVALVGFAPGFPYLVPADGTSIFTNIPRLTTPRSAVPSGAVAVAAGMSAIYPNTMPGGWMLLGHTDTPLFAPQSAAPSLLSAGDLVTFVEVRA